MPEIPLVPSLWRFPAHPASVGRARAVVAEVRPAGLPAEVALDLRLVTSELVTNAIRYGARRREEEVVEVVLWPADGHYWVAVSDPGSGKPEPAGPAGNPRADSERGRGLVLVDSLAAAWAVVPRAVRGKCVVAGLPLVPGG